MRTKKCTAYFLVALWVCGSLLDIWYGEYNLSLNYHVMQDYILIPIRNVALRENISINLELV